MGAVDSGSKLIGKWRLIDTQGHVDVGDEGVTMEFFADGNCDYTIHSADKDQIMKLTYRIEGDCIVSNQPSHPKEETTRFSFDDEERLILEFEEATSRFEKASMEEAGS